jgi:hypothetical protein
MMGDPAGSKDEESGFEGRERNGRARPASPRSSRTPPIVIDPARRDGDSPSPIAPQVPRHPSPTRRVKASRPLATRYARMFPEFTSRIAAATPRSAAVCLGRVRIPKKKKESATTSAAAPAAIEAALCVCRRSPM